MVEHVSELGRILVDMETMLRHFRTMLEGLDSRAREAADVEKHVMAPDLSS